MAHDLNNEQFLLQATHGPPAGLHCETSSPLLAPVGVEVRIVDAAHMKTVNSVYDTFGLAWHFPPWFGRNAHAFDDFMRDLHNMIDAATGKSPAPGYLTDVRNAHLLLADQPDSFSWFAGCTPFYRDYYRDEASPPAAFGMLLSAPTERLDDVRQRWLAAGIGLADVTV